MKRLLGSVSLVVMGVVSAFAVSVVYENDFSTRTSAVAIPSPRWQVSAPYRCGLLCNNYGWYSIQSAYGDQNKIQDCWAKASDGNASYEADFVVTNDVAGGNQYAIFVNSGTLSNPANDHRTSVVHPFYNRISSGLLRVQVDIRAPSEYQKVANNNVFVGPYFEKFVNLNWNGKTFQYPGMFGANIKQNETVDAIYCYSYGGDGNGANTYNGDWAGKKLVAGHWYRYVMDYDLNANTFSGKVYDMGDVTPTFESTGTDWTTLAARPFYKNMGGDNGPLTGFVIRDAGSVSGRDEAFERLKAPGVDNIRFWWRAGGTDFTDADLFYENDFTTRRYRTIVAGSSSTAHVYTPTHYATVTNEFTQYVTNKFTSLPGTILIADSTRKKEPQPYGVDGWRRLNCDGYLNPSVVWTPESGNMLAISAAHSSNNRFGLQAQALGETITGGDVKFSYDFRTPDKWYSDTRYVWAMLCPEAYLNSGTDNEQSTLYAARLGVFGGSETTFNFANIVGSKATRNDGSAAQPNRWYRGVMTVHLDTKTVDTEIYDLGESPVAMGTVPTGDAVFSRTGDAARNSNLADISCFAFFTFGAGGKTDGTLNEKGLVYIDNLQVWKRATAEDAWQDVYSNDFTTRRRYTQKRTVTPLVWGIDRVREDGWVARNNAAEVLEISGGEGVNPALYADCQGGVESARTLEKSSGDYTWVTQQLGDSVRDGMVTIQTDIRPPRTWTTAQSGGARASLIFGNDRYFQGNRNAVDCFLDEKQIEFGFAVQNKDYKSFGRYPTSKACCFNADDRLWLDATIDPTHWYRFGVKSSLSRGTYSLKLYDLGTAHPTFATATPATPIATADNVHYAYPLEAGEGISTLAVGSIGVMNERPWEIDDPGLQLYDNIRVTHSPNGVIVIIR